MDKSHVLVGIGCSAGGVEALKSIVGGLRSEHATYIFVQHLSPDHESMMVPILNKLAKMPVLEAENGAELKAGCIYTTPPGSLISVENGRFTLEKINMHRARGPLHTIDLLFESLAEEYKEMSIGVILSGSGSDGLRGCREIKEAGGVVITQNPENAQFPSMPSNIVQASLHDKSLDLEDISINIEDFIVQLRKSYELFGPESKINSVFPDIIDYVSAESKIDFTRYKVATLFRRLQKRMALEKTTDAREYLALLKRDSQVCQELAQDFLIGVTAFFRDKKFFEALNRKVIYPLAKKAHESSKRVNSEIRVWVPACSTGEEVFSIAMLLEDTKNEYGFDFEYRIFGSDIDPKAITSAQMGVFNYSSLQDLPKHFLGRYFTEQKDETFKISRTIKDKVIFSRHDITCDPPFSRMDLISFRNCSIYLNKKTQKEIIAILEHSLSMHGYLFLGPSETLPKESAMDTLHSSAKIFQKNSLKNSHAQYDLTKIQSDRLKTKSVVHSKNKSLKNELFLSLGHEIIGSFLGAAAVLNKSGELLHIFGDVSPYISLQSGSYEGTFFDFLPPQMRSSLNLAMKKLLSPSADKKPVSIRVTDTEQSKPGATLIEVRPYLFHGFDTVFLVNFISLDKEGNKKGQGTSSKDEFDLLKAELDQSRKDLEFSVESLETTNEELQSTNEELVTSNEELQSTNEELQSVNEELHTMNAEFQDKIEELSLLNSDMDILLDVSQVGTIFMDSDFKLRRVSERALSLLSLNRSDIGRSLKQFRSPLYENFILDCEEVLREKRPKEKNIELSPNDWSLIKIHPHLTKKDELIGLVVLVVNITELKSIKDSHSDAYKLIISDIEANFSVSLDGKIVSWSTSAQEFFDLKKDEMIGKDESIILPLSAKDDLELIYTTVQKGETVYLNKTYRLNSKDEAIAVKLIARGSYDDKGNCVGIDYSLFKEDITKDRTDWIENEFSTMRDILENAPVALIVLDQTGQFRFANNCAREILKLNSKDIFERTYNDKAWSVENLDGGPLKEKELPFRKVIREEKAIQNMHITLVNGNNERIRLGVTGSPLFSSGKIKGAVFSLIEMS